jgi:hypothetical protein
MISIIALIAQVSASCTKEKCGIWNTNEKDCNINVVARMRQEMNGQMKKCDGCSGFICTGSKIAGW